MTDMTPESEKIEGLPKAEGPPKVEKDNGPTKAEKVEGPPKAEKTEGPPKGLSAMFNSTTIRGRANVAKATYAAIALTFIYFKFIKRKAPKPEDPKGPENKFDMDTGVDAERNCKFAD